MADSKLFINRLNVSLGKIFLVRRTYRVSESWLDTATTIAEKAHRASN